MKNKINVLLIVVSAVLCIVCAYYGVSLLIEQRTQQANFDYMQNQAHDIEETESTDLTEVVLTETEVTESEQQEETAQPEIPIDFASLKEEYPDIYAWIVVPGTNVDYAIVQHPTDDSYYLGHGYKGETTSYGAIYTESCNKKDFSDPMTVLYGHNMKDGMMFASLHEFESKDFFDTHTEFTIYTEDHIYTYRIFGAYIYSDVHILKHYDFRDKKVFKNYLDDIYSTKGMTSYFIDKPKATINDKIVTLSTCIGTDHSSRYLVQGVLVKEE